MGVILRHRNLKSGQLSYYLDIHHNGERWREFLDIRANSAEVTTAEKRKIAKQKKANRELELLSEQTDYVPMHFRNMNFFKFAQEYIENYKLADINVVRASLSKFKESANNERLTISQISPRIMESYKTFLIYDANLSGETPSNYFTRFKKILKAAKIAGYIKFMPTVDIRFSNPNKEDSINKQVLDESEIQKMAITFCGNYEVKMAFLFATQTSLGLAEIKRLEWRHILNGRVIIKRSKTRRTINNRLNTSALKLIGKRKDKNDYVFDIQNLSTNGANKAIRYWVKRAGIDKHITFYCARHTFACQLLLNGANLKTVSTAMGHASVNTTLKYLNYVERLQDQAIDNLPAFEVA